MHSIKTSGIVLKGANFGEADKILTVFTERLGKVKVLARGVRKIKSHLAGSLEPFILSELLLHEGKTFYSISGAQILESYPTIHDDIAKIARVFFLGELIDNFVTLDEKSGPMFELFVSALDSLENNSKDILLLSFQLKIVEAAGFKPELFDCVHCKEKIIAGDNFWDNLEGGVICESCQQKFHHGKSISDNAIKLLRFIEQNKLAETERIKDNLATREEAEKILTLYVRGILEKELKSESFLKMI
ncbi:MAG TPA: DNA repair protein RecO [Patescibacteria group bacterium]|nr:DNA repair protein RecO [Patescibacteria group bacterium]